MWAEGFFACAVLGAGAWAGWRFFTSGYLPQPFLYDLNYPLMGLYDTAYWANHAGAYGPGRSIYPPLSFVFLRLVTRGACYALGPAAGRRCDGSAAWAMLGVYFLNILLVYRAFRPQGRAAALCRTTAVCLGLPMLYGLECANLIIVSFTVFVLAFGAVVRWAPPRWLALGLAINFKPYLMVVWLPSILGRRWRWLAGTVVATGLVYLLTWALQGSGSPGNLGGDLLLYAIVISHNAWSDVYYATSYWPLIHLMTGPSRLFGLVTAGQAGAWVSLLTLLIRGAQIGVAACLVAGARRPAAIDTRRFCAMILALVLTTLAPGQSGYVQIFVFFLVFLEPWRRPLQIAVLLATYLLCIPADHILLRLIHGPAWSYLGGREVTADFGLSVGQLIRPGLLLIVQYGLIALNLRDVVGPPPRAAPEPA